jgi:hypothetical protein
VRRYQFAETATGNSAASVRELREAVAGHDQTVELLDSGFQGSTWFQF